VTVPAVGRLLLAGVLFAALLATAQAGPGFSFAVARPAPPFLLQDPQGGYHRLVDYSGKVLIVNFWASWCAPCREELPLLNQVWSQLKGGSVAMLAVNVSDDRDAVSAFMQDYPIDFDVLLDPHGHVSRRWQVTGLPTTFVIDPYGRITHRLVGKRDWERSDLLQLVRDLERSR